MSRPKIVHIEDKYPSVQQLIELGKHKKYLLYDEIYEVLPDEVIGLPDEVDDGATALERAAAHTGRIDLLITDVVIPGMSARELADRLLVLHPTAKVIYMSGYPDAAIGDQGVSARGVVFLQKPFTPEARGRKVREALE